jgi:predicted nucleic acid-binding protein
VLVEIFRSPQRSARYEKIMSKIGDSETFISIVQIAEIADWAIRNKAPPSDRIARVKQVARIVVMDDEICLRAATIKSKRRKAGYSDFSIVDGIVLATARSMNQRLLTFDRNYTGEDDCLILS